MVNPHRNIKVIFHPAVPFGLKSSAMLDSWTHNEGPAFHAVESNCARDIGVRSFTTKNVPQSRWLWKLVSMLVMPQLKKHGYHLVSSQVVMNIRKSSKTTNSDLAMSCYP